MLKANIHRGNVILVNATYGFQPQSIELAEVAPGVQLQTEAAHQLYELMQTIGCGDAIVPVSGYRPHAEQVQLYEDALREHGEAFTRQYVALPGHSEHETGLAIDVGENIDEIDFIRPSFPYDGICGAFRAHAAAFGFVERYPAGKEAITGIAHEPWHFRYVGIPHAAYMQAHGMTLEEYVAELRLAGRITIDNATVFYAKGTQNMPEGAQDTLSGNNVDGFLWTIWEKKE